MCGICGVVHLDQKPVSPELIRGMNNSLEHRGPDGEGLYLNGQVALAMRRLKIIDVAGSDQPLYNEDQSIALIFNGEIYNYQYLRQHLQAKGHQFHTQGDGETIIHLYEEYGTDAVKHLRGMFAFALWDTNRQILYAARDRTGQKPLYYWFDGNSFVFGSEIKAILKHPDVPRQSAFTDAKTLALFLGYGYVPAPQTAFQNIFMLLPGHYLTLQTGEVQTKPYWSFPEIAESDSHATLADYQAELHDTLEQSVKMRLMSEVPLGAFLSGGLDSSLIVAIMQKHSTIPVKTFSIGFEGDDSFDETAYAQQVAETLHTDHTAFHVRPSAMELLPKLVWHYDQPFADTSAIPTFLVSQLTRQQVTVALSGDGGDELFVGYERFYAASLVQKLGIIPEFAWRTAHNLLRFLPEGTGYYNFSKRLRRFVQGASQPLTHAYYDWIRVFHADGIHDLVNQPDYAVEHFAGIFQQKAGLPAIVHANMNTYLPDDLLIKADRCSMATSLEARAPFLDHELIELTAKIPLNLKLNGNITKHILKEIARNYLPDTITDRRKHGFGAPIGTWLRKDIHQVREVLLSQEARNRQLFHMSGIEHLLQEHESGKRDHGQRLWTLLTLEWWHRLFMDQSDIMVPELSPLTGENH